MAQRLLIVCLALLLAATACGREEAPAGSACPDGHYPAVQLGLVDEAGETLSGASLRYRLDEGPWEEWPENTGQRTVIRGGPGAYRVEVAKTGHENAGTTLVVPAESADACRPILQAVTLQLARLPCPDSPEALLLTLDPPPDELEVSATKPDSGREALRCLEEVGGSCKTFSLPVDALGQYSLDLTGLPGLGAMRVVSDVVAYEVPAVALLLAHRGQEKSVALDGAEAAVLSFPVRRDEANCALADFRALEMDAEPDPESEGEQPPLALHYQGSLTITDLGADACGTEPVLTLLPFTVDLPAGTGLAEIEVLVEYGQGLQPATCKFAEGVYGCQALVPNPLLNRPFSARVRAAGAEAVGLGLPFSGMCLIFR